MIEPAAGRLREEKDLMHRLQGNAWRALLAMAIPVGRFLPTRIKESLDSGVRNRQL